ncbi:MULTISPECIES: 3-deoxy-D-manno-octulosonic acid transferase [unclassified Xanthobacter]|uniref:3-deoxy-D-manno-octulosonic acid transferase n=1 Tax=unclassified Xanthobacter TaxID=2623496 RepID=UPI001EDE19AA|nr:MULTISPECIES: 3-deoxy-D-manno-octulosonic acid transferase [unclassified Xanthobacter]
MKRSRALPVPLRLYRGASSAAALLTPAWLSYRVRKGKEDPERLSERRGYPSAERPEGPLIWVHGASVGEVNCVLPLIERLRQRGFEVLLTSGTLTSSRVAAHRAPDGVIHQFVPLDAAGFVRRFLDHWQPDLVLLAESELWPNLLSELSRRDTPTVLVNGRLSPRSARRWSRLKGSARALLRRVDLCLAQSEEDGGRFRALGAERVEVCGNLKFDVPPPAVDGADFDEFARALGPRPLLLAASTHPGEDEVVMAAHGLLRQQMPDLLTVIVPRHPERGDSIVGLADAAGWAAAQRSRDELPAPDADLYVADTLGELGLFYRLAPVSFVGGSLVPRGGQNPIEAIKLGSVVLHGPHVGNFADTYGQLDAQYGALPVSDADSLARTAFALMHDPELRAQAASQGQKTLEALGGALEHTLHAIEPYLIQIRLQHR